MTGDLAENCWILTDGTAGMENQCLGLAERIALPARVFRLKVKEPWRWIAPATVGSPFAHLNGGERPAPPWPRLAIGCGRQSIPFMRAIRKKSRGATVMVQCQDPRVSATDFDLVVPPEHDALTGANVFSILGSPNRITPGRLSAARDEFMSLFAGLRKPRIAVLIGGPNRVYRFEEKDARDLGFVLREIARDYGMMITASRRTGPASQQVLRDLLKGTDAYFWDGTGINPYLGILAWADVFLVTADSVNMACEAGATGKPVYIWPLPGGGGKFAKFHASLVRRGVARPFTGAIESWKYEPLDETGRAAQCIRALLDARKSAPDMKVWVEGAWQKHST